jgi:CPA2 family monovalent cation:H+ antiporter-2
LLTRFLIQHADRIIALHDRLAPRSFLSYQHDYTAWIGRLRAAKVTSAPRQWIRRILWQLSINVALIAGIYLAALLPNRFTITWLEQLPAWTGGRRTVLWFLATLCSLPVFIATLRKMEAFSMLISEMAVRERVGLMNKAAMRALVSNTTMFTGIVGLALLVLLLSSVLLPSWEVFLVLLGISILLSVLLRSFFIKIYSQAQSSIHDTLTRNRSSLGTKPNLCASRFRPCWRTPNC